MSVLIRVLLGFAKRPQAIVLCHIILILTILINIFSEMRVLNHYVVSALYRAKTESGKDIVQTGLKLSIKVEY